MDNKRTQHLSAIVTGFFVIGISLIMLSIFPRSAELTQGYTSPIIAFEFARSEVDIAFLSGESEASIENRQAMRDGHKWDMVFPLSYALFLFLLVWQFRSQSRSLWIPLSLSVLIVPFDINENFKLIGLIEAAENSSLSFPLFKQLYVATWLKWGAIALTVSFLLSQYLANRQWFMSASSGVYVGISLVCFTLGTPPKLAEAMAVSLSLFLLVAFIQQVILYRQSGNLITSV